MDPGNFDSSRLNSPLIWETLCVHNLISVAFMQKLIRRNRSATPSGHSNQGDTPSAQLSKLGYGPYHTQRLALSQTSANTNPDIVPSIFYKPKYIEKGNPLQDEEKLLRGLPIVEPEDEVINTIRKVPSDQALMPMRWGSKRRATGRSKSGLQV